MEQMFIKEAEISDVSQEISSSGRINIEFKLNNHRYYVVVLKDHSGSFEPIAVRHLFKEICPFCQYEYVDYEDCSSFHSDLTSLFHHLIQFPSVRLEWLFIDHS